MKNITFIFIFLFVATATMAQQQRRVSYPKPDPNLREKILVDAGEEDSDPTWYHKFRADVKAELLLLEGKWVADEDPELVLDLRFREKYVVSFGYEDQLLVRGIEHPEFPFPYQMLLFPYNANYLDYFRVFLSYHGRTPETFKPENFEDKHIQILTEAGVFEELDIDALTRLLVEGDLRVLDPNVRDLLGSDNADEVVLANARGGMLGGVMFLEDENTMILLIESCVAPASLDPDATMGHYEIGTLPDYFLERVNKVFLNNRIFTFRRQ